LSKWRQNKDSGEKRIRIPTCPHCGEPLYTLDVSECYEEELYDLWDKECYSVTDMEKEIEDSEFHFSEEERYHCPNCGNELDTELIEDYV